MKLASRNHFQILHSGKAIIPNEARFKLSAPQLLGAYFLPVELLVQALTNKWLWYAHICITINTCTHRHVLWQ